MDTSDRSVLAAIRENGDSAAYAELYHRHVDAARGAAWKIAPQLDGDDLVAESFTRILQALKNGAGPAEAFRPYLYQTIRRLSFELAAQAAHSDIADQDQLVDPDSLDDPGEAIAQRDLVTAALADMPERWRAVLWYTEVEGYAPREMVPVLGLTATNIAQIRSRALKRLRRRLGLATPASASSRDTSMGRRIAVAVLGAPTAVALFPLFEGEASLAFALASSGGAQGASATASSTLLGKGLLASGALTAVVVAGVLLLSPSQGGEHDRSPGTPVSGQRAGEPEQGSSRQSSREPVGSPSGSGTSSLFEGTTRSEGGGAMPAPLDPGPWSVVPQQDPVVRGPVG